MEPGPSALAGDRRGLHHAGLASFRRRVSPGEHGRRAGDRGNGSAARQGRAVAVRSDAAPRPASEPFYPEAAVSTFLYTLGNVVAAIGRDEPIPASNGVILVRDVCLVGLLLAEQGLASTREANIGNPFPFTKRLRRYLTDEQNAILESLPPVAPSIESAIDGYVALAEIFIPRAKRLAEATGTRWPEEFEQASVSYFEKSVGVQLAL